MAEAPTTKIEFPPELPGQDCSRRVVVGLPAPLPEIGDDFDWHLRDYDGFRLFMMEELAARAPERQRWTPADMEVVLVEVLAAVLDQLSDMADRVAAEQYLETARRPETLRGLLRFIGYDAAALAYAAGHIATNPAASEENAGRAAVELERFWRDNPHIMEEARVAGPRDLHVQHRMVTVDDYGALLEAHPLVRRAGASVTWGGMLHEVRIAVLPHFGEGLDKPYYLKDLHEDAQQSAEGVKQSVEDIKRSVDAFHRARQLPEPSESATLRNILTPYVEAYRMIGQPVRLTGVQRVPIDMSLAIQVRNNFYLSEVRNAVEQALGTADGGFFEPDRLRFGEAVRAGDVYQTVMALEGVETVTLTRFQRASAGAANELASGRISIGRFEIATSGEVDLDLRGGRRA